MLHGGNGNDALKLAGTAVALLLAMTLAAPAGGETLDEVLATVYRTDSAIRAAHEALRARNQLAPQALSGWMPTVQGLGSLSRMRVDGTPRNSLRVDENVAELRYTQNLFRSGGDRAALQRADWLILQARAQAIITEQTRLVRTATAYVDVVRTRRIMELRQSALRAFEERLRETEAQFRIGDRTVADLAQARAEVELARADIAAAEADRDAAVATFTEMAGVAPGDLTRPEVPGTLPETLDVAVMAGKTDSPGVRAAVAAWNAARADVDAIAAEMGPSVDFVGRVTQIDRQSSQPFIEADEQEQAIALQLTIPLYQGGGTGARLRQGKFTVSQRLNELRTEIRSVEQRTTTAWLAMTAGRQRRAALDRAVEASEVAVRSVMREAEVGERTLREVLDAERQLASARLDAVSAWRDEFVQSVAVLEAIGRMTAETLGLPVAYVDFEAEYRDARWNLLPDILSLGD